MRTAVLVKNGEIADFPADLMIDGEICKSYNIIFECEMKKINLVIGKSMPSDVIKSLRDKGIMFLKAKSIQELENVDLEIKIPKNFGKKRGWGCSKNFLSDND